MGKSEKRYGFSGPKSPMPLTSGTLLSRKIGAVEADTIADDGPMDASTLSCWMRRLAALVAFSGLDSSSMWMS